MKNTARLCTFSFLISASLAQNAHALLGTEVHDTASKFTCLIVKPNGDQVCQGSLISPTEVQTASHCFSYLWYKDRNESPKVLCGFEPGSGFKLEINSLKEVRVSKSTNFRKDEFFDDQMLLTLATEAEANLQVTLATKDELRKIFTSPRNDGKFGLSPNYRCKIESYTSPVTPRGESAILRAETLSYDDRQNIIQMNYPPIPLDTIEKREAVLNAQDKNGHLSSFVSVYRLVNFFKTPVLTHQGDSGGPLYCYQNGNEDHSKVVVGFLSKGTNKMEEAAGGLAFLHLGSLWNTPIQKGQMETKSLGKLSIIQKRSLNAVPAEELLPF